DVGGQHVRRELDPLEGGADGARKGGRERRLSHPRHGLDADMPRPDEQIPAREETDAGEPDNLGLAHEGAAHVLLEPTDQISGVGHRLSLYTGDSAGHAAPFRGISASHLPSPPAPRTIDHSARTAA